MPVSGIATSISVGLASVAMTNEATTVVTANTVYRITDATKRVIDPRVAVTVEVDADGAGGGSYATASASTYVIDYLAGTITFSSDQGSSALVRISGNYIQREPLVEGTSVSFMVGKTVLDSTVFHASHTHRKRILGSQSASGSITHLQLPSTDIDSTGATASLYSLHAAGTIVVIEVQPGGSGPTFRSFGVLTDVKGSATPDDLVNFVIDWQSTAFVGTGQTEGVSFSFVS